MRFFIRAFGALFIVVLTVSLLSVSGIRFKMALEEKAENSFKSRYGKERTYSAYIDEIQSREIAPKIYAYGEAKSWRSLEIRATNSGQLIFLSDKFREGGSFKKGELIFKIDPRESLDSFAVAEVNLLEASAEYEEARNALELLKLELKDSEEQSKLRKSALNRQKTLNDSGITTKSEVENAEILYSNAKQTVLARKNALAKGEAQIARAKIAVTRATISLEQTKRRLEDNEYKAPFDGVISSVLVSPGRLLNKNELLGVLIDPDSIEVVFEVSNLEFSRIADANGDVMPLPIQVRKEEGAEAIVLKGIIQRSGAKVVAGTAGRQIFASLQGGKTSFVQAGDFLIVEIEEKSLSNVAVVPSAAIDSESTLLLLDQENRLEEYFVNILRRQNDQVIIDKAPFGRKYVTNRSPQLDAGLKVNPLRVTCSNDNNEKCGVQVSQDSMVTLSEDDRVKLLEFVNANNRLPDEVKKSLIKRLKSEKVSTRLVDRLKKQLEKK